VSERLVRNERTYTQRSLRVPGGATTFQEFRAVAPGRCAGIELGDGKFSGCAYGDGEDPKKFGDDVCPACNNTGLATPA